MGDDDPAMKSTVKTAKPAQADLSGMCLSSDALSFCRRNRIASELSLAVDLVRRYFSIIGDPVVNLVQDPEVEHAKYLVIEVQVRGGVEENVAAHKRFASEASQLLGPKRELILLHYSMI
jgi:hypothetical protein